MLSATLKQTTLAELPSCPFQLSREELSETEELSEDEFIAGTFSEISHPEEEIIIAERIRAVKSFLYFVTCFLRENECWIFYYHPISFATKRNRVIPERKVFTPLLPLPRQLSP